MKEQMNEKEMGSLFHRKLADSQIHMKKTKQIPHPVCNVYFVPHLILGIRFLSPSSTKYGPTMPFDDTVHHIVMISSH